MTSITDNSSEAKSMKKVDPIEAEQESETYEIGIFFGAGAEIGYGMPSGGRFALEVFKREIGKERESLKNLIKNVDSKSVYANYWLPNGYSSKRVYSFGKSEYITLVESSLENQRHSIISFLNNFDKECLNLLRSDKFFIDVEKLDRLFGRITDGKSVGDIIYGNEIELNAKLNADTTLFKSEYFCAMLEVCKLSDNKKESLLKQVLTSFLQLLVTSYGKGLVSSLNNQVFTSAPDEIAVFDDISSMFKIDYSRAGSLALEIVLRDVNDDVDTENISNVFGELGRQLLQSLIEKSLDYRSLVDSHFRYLYSPYMEWAKFTKISLFLFTARNYIKSCVPSDFSQTREGYYHDLLKLKSNKICVKSIGTANYNNLVRDVLKDDLPDLKVSHLNGSVNEFYNPYLNTIVELNEDALSKQSHIVVPFIFTQSGIKPLTSVRMSRRYVELYDDFLDVDAIVVVGFGFNSDDGHINGLFRALVDDERKNLIVVGYDSGQVDIHERKRDYLGKIRIQSKERLHVIAANKERKVKGKMWYEEIYTILRGL